MKKIYLSIAVIAAFLTSFTTFGQAGCSTLAITNTTPATINCGGSATLTATSSGTGDEIYWYDAATGGNLLGTGGTYNTSVLGSNTTYYATEVLLGGGGGGTLPTYCTPTHSTGCGSGDEIDDFVLSDSSGANLIQHLATACSPAPNYYSDYTSDASLTANLMVGETYDFSITHNFGSQYIQIWIDFDQNGSFADAGESLFVSSLGSSTGTPTTGSISIPAGALSGETVMRVMDSWNSPPVDACTPGSGYGETHDYKVTIISVVCESTPRTPVTVTVNTIGDKQVPSTTTPSVYTDTENTANFGDSYSGVPGNNCGTTSNYLGGNEVVYHYTAGDSYGLNIAMSGLSAGESGVFVYDTCLDIGSQCIDGMTSATTTDYDFDMYVQNGEDYYIVVSSSAATGTLGYTLTLTETASPCQNLAISSSIPGSVCGQGSVTLEATASGIGDEVYWYDSATGGNLVGMGSTFETPVLNSTTSYWATEVILSTAAGSGQLPELLYYKFDTGGTIANDALNPVGNNPASITGSGLSVGGTGLSGTALQGTGASSSSNVIDTGWNANLSGSFTIGFWTSNIQPSSTLWYIWGDSGAGGFRCFTNGAAGANNWLIRGGGLPDIEVTGGATMNPNYIHIVYDASAGTYSSYLDGVLNNSVSATTSNTMSGSGFTIGGYTSSSGLNGLMDEFRIYDRALTVAEIQTTISSTVGAVVICESTPRVQVDATVDNNADKQVSPLTLTQAYSDTDDTANFADNYSGSPGCATTGDFLDGNDVVYHWTADDDYLVNVDMSGLGSGGSGVFVYESCADIGTLCLDGETGGPGNYGFQFAAQNGQDYYFVVSGDGSGSYAYTIDISLTALDCTNYSITATTDDIVPCIGRATLTATASGLPNTEIFWYDTPTGGQPIGMGSPFLSPEISTNTSYWVSEVLLDGGGGQMMGQGKVVPTGTLATTLSNYGLEFDVAQAFTLVSVDVYPNSSSSGTGTVTIELQDSSGTVLQSATGNTTAGAGPVTIPLNFNIQPGTAYRLMKQGSVSLIRDTSGNNFPYSLGAGGVLGSITSGRFSSGTSTSYYFFYNWVVSSGTVICESPRVQVDATISTAGDITVTTPLPYTDTNDTGNYGNPYEGTPGDATLCGTTENYLNGNDVVYHFTAQNTELVNIMMSGLSAYYASVFVYDSCAELGTDCLAGAVNGPSDDDFAIMDFPVTAGEDYYIVVSSWLTPSYSYTLDIIPFDCANLEAPDGDANQDFVTGDTVSALDVDPTRPGATLTFYEELTDIPGNPITGDPALINGEDYFVTQTYNGCEGAPLQIDVTEIDCSMLAITSTTPGSVTCRGKVTLGAVGSGQGDDLYWWDVATGGTPVGTGPQFETDELSTTTSFWVSEVYATGISVPNQGKVAPTGSLSFGSTLNYGLEFDVSQQFTLTSVDIYPDDVAGTVEVSLFDNSGTLLQTANINVSASNGTVAYTVPLNFQIPPGTGYRLLQTSNPSLDLIRDSSGNSFPYPLGTSGNLGSINNGTYGTSTLNSGSYYYFYNWVVSTGSMICESPRTQVDATVIQTGDITVDYTDLSYTTTDNTGNYGNNFSGDAGTNCDGTDILGGNEVIYRYTADTNNDDILDIELSGISNPNTGMYVYASCGDVGINCLAGGTNENSANIFIDDYYVTAGTEIFIVISSASSSTNYTLTINGIDCSNVAAPTVNTAPLSFISGDVLDDLDVDFNQYGTLTWYASPSDIPGNPLPSTTAVVDGTTYYVTQTILGCESAPLAITPEEFQCGDMKIASVTPDFTICAPGGNVTLNAQGTGLGSEVYWYDAATGGNVVNAGQDFDTNVSTTTSFWVSEVYIEGGTLTSGYGMIAGIGDLDNYQNDYGLVFDAYQNFTLASVEVYNEDLAAQTIDVELRDSGGMTVQSITGILLPAGNGTSGGPSAPTTVQLNFNVPAGTGWQLVATNVNADLLQVSSGSTNFPYPLGVGGTTGEITTGKTSSGTSGQYNYFFNWTISTGTVVCESARTEITVTVNDQPTAAPTGLAAQKLCEGATLADIPVNGANVQWYDVATGGSVVASTTVLNDGEVYYASQTVDACESDLRLEVTVYIDPIAPAPTGNINQSFVNGETLLDLDVTGDNLTWYDDKGNEIVDPANFVLDNYDTYCVTQAPQGFCESEELCITVHENILGSDDPLFENLVYHPNPVKHQLNISNSSPIEKVALYDLLGRKVMEQKVNAPKATLDVSGLQGGTYLLWVTIDGKMGTFKLIKE